MHHDFQRCEAQLGVSHTSHRGAPNLGRQSSGSMNGTRKESDVHKTKWRKVCTIGVDFDLVAEVQVDCVFQKVDDWVLTHDFERMIWKFGQASSPRMYCTSLCIFTRKINVNSTYSFCVREFSTLFVRHRP